MRRVLYGVGSLMGLGALLAPLFLPLASTLAAVLVTLAVSLILLVLVSEAQGLLASPQALALLAMLTAVNASLRFIENAIPGPGGFSPIFFLIVLTGYVLGARMGLLLGVLTLLVSAFITGGVGPWLPYQMLLAGWVGLGAPLLRPLSARFPRYELLWLTLYGLLWGFLYGLLANLWFWPFFATLEAETAGLMRLRHYGLFYLATSLGWDAFRAAGNALLMLTLGAPTLRILRRFQRRLQFQALSVP
jgi:energy-coupling factor transport system substrate-specific component